jgi:hypothetical protein
MTKPAVPVKKPVNVTVRPIGRRLARVLTKEEFVNIFGKQVGRLAAVGTHGTDDHTPTGNPCQDCD